MGMNTSIPHSNVVFNTPLQAVAVRTTLHKTITICSLYIPPPDIVNSTELDNLIHTLPEPFIVLGDLNGNGKQNN